VNSFLGLARPILARILKENKGRYFSPDYSMNQYPRSKAVEGLIDSNEFRQISRYAAGSGICRTIIDLDRYLYLAEHGYNIWYEAEMFIAARKVEE